MVRTTFFAVLLAIGAQFASADEIQIEAKRPDQVAQKVDIRLEIRGEIAADPDADGGNLPMEVDASIGYVERQLRSQKSDRLIRRYEHATAKIDLGHGQVLSQLKDDNHWIIVDRRQEPEGDFRIRYLTSGTGLSQPELDLIHIPANTAVWDLLLDQPQIGENKSWKADDALLADAFAVDRILENQVQFRLVAVSATTAEIRVTGTMIARAHDAETEMTIDGTCQFDRAQGFTRTLNLSINESRETSGAAPGYYAVTKLALTADRPAEDALPYSEMTRLGLDKQRWSDYLTCTSPSGQFMLRHSRNWRLIDNDQHVSVFRYISDTALLGQCNIEPMNRIPSAEAFTLEAFKKTVAEKTAQDGIVKDGRQWTTDRGLKIMCVEVDGKPDDIDVIWLYYHIAQPDGQRVSCLVTYDAEVAGQFKGAEKPLVESLTFLRSAEVSSTDSSSSSR